MTQSDRQRRIGEIVEQALEFEGEAREEQLRESCDDPEMRAEVNERIRHRKLEEIFNGAEGLTGQALQDYLEEACGDDKSLRADVESLLRHDPGVTAGPAPSGAPSAFGSLVGEVLGRYRVIDVISEDDSGMGNVYRAEQLRPIRREVAIKVLQPKWITSREVTERFKDEARMLTILDDHSNIARIFDTGETRDGRPYFVMEYIPGGTHLCSFCDGARLAIRDRLRLFHQACEAVEYAHSHRIIHRDIKPSNILATKADGDGPRVKVIDFGIAKAIGDQWPRNREDSLITPLTRAYASPEQLRAHDQGLPPDTITLQSDVFSLGLVLYELLAGRSPYDSDADQKSILINMAKDIPPPSACVASAGDKLELIAEKRSEHSATLARRLRGELDWVTMKALEIETGRRYPTVSHLKEDVEHLLRGERVEAGAQSVLYRTSKFIARNRWPVAAAVALALGILSSLAILLVSAERMAEVNARLEQFNEELAQSNAELAESNARLVRLGIRAYAGLNVILEGAISRHDARAAEGAMEGTYDTVRVQGYAPGTLPWERRHLQGRVSNDVGRVSVNGRVNDIAVAPDGRWAAALVPGAHPLHLIDLANLKSLELTEPAGNDMRAVAFHPSGEYVVAGGGSFRKPGEPSQGPGLLQVWRAADGSSLGAWPLPDIDLVRSIEFLPDPDRFVLAVLGTRGGVYLYEWSSEEQLDRPPVMEAMLRESFAGSTARMLTFHPQARYLAVADQYSRDIDLWDVEASLALARAGAEDDPAGAQPAGGPCGVRAALLRGVHAYHLHMISFSPDGGLLASASMDKSIVLWDVEASVLAQRDWIGAYDEYARRRGAGPTAAGPPPQQPAPNVAARLSEDDKQGSIAVTFLRSAGRTILFSAGADGTVRQWWIGPLNRDGGGVDARRQATWMGHTRSVYAMDAVAAEGLIVTGSDDGTVRLWAPDVEVPPTLTGHTSSVLGVAFSDDGRYAFSLDGNRNLFVHEVRSGAEVASLEVADIGQPSRPAYDRSLGRLVTAIQRPDGHVVIIDVEEPTAPRLVTSFRPFDDQDDAQSVGLALAGSGRLAIGDSKGRLQIWDIAGDAPSRISGLREVGPGRVRALAFLDSEGTLLVSTNETDDVEDWTGGSPVITRWAINEDGVEALSPITTHHTEPITDFAVDEQRRWLATASGDRRVDLWAIDPSSTEWLAHENMLEGHIEGVMSVAFHPTEPRLVSGAMDRTIKLWDVNSGIEVATLRGQGGWSVDLAFSHDGERLLSGSSGYEGTDNVAYLWDTFEDEQERRETTRERAIARSARRLMWGWVYSEGLGADAIRSRIDEAGSDFLPAMREALRQALEVRLRDERWAPLMLVQDAVPLLQREAFDEALEMLLSAATLHPRNEQMISYITQLRRHVIDTEAGREALMAWLGEDRSYPESLTVPIAGALDAMGDEEMALDILARTDLQTSQGLNTSAWIIVRSPNRDPRQYEQAVVRATRADGASPNNGAILNTLGVALYRVSDYEQALQTLVRSNEMHRGEEPSDWAFLALTHHALGDDGAAGEALTRLRELMAIPANQEVPDNVRVAEEAESVLSHLLDGASDSE